MSTTTNAVIDKTSTRGPTHVGTTAAELYAAAPWYRRNGHVSSWLLVGLATGLLWLLSAGWVEETPSEYAPAWLAQAETLSVLLGGIASVALLLTCIVVLTGPVYWKTCVAPGRLKTWSVANKVLALGLLVGWVSLLALQFR